jgi:hypothetical protein
MRVLLSTYDSRGGVEPPAGLAVPLQELGAALALREELSCCFGTPLKTTVPIIDRPF